MKKNIYAVLLIVACAVNGSIYAMTPEQAWKVLSPEELESKAQKEAPQEALKGFEAEIITFNDMLLFQAIRYNRPDVVEYLLERGANPNIVDPQFGGGTPLSFAIGKGNDQIIGILLEHGADPNFQFRRWGISDETTMLHAAAFDGRANWVKKLLQIGADPTIQNEQGETPYDVATGAAKQVLKDEMDKRMGAAMLSIRERKYGAPRDVEGEIAKAIRKYH